MQLLGISKALQSLDRKTKPKINPQECVGFNYHSKHKDMKLMIINSC